MTVDSCRRHVGEVLEVRYRLRRIWDRVVEGDLPWWRAARIGATHDAAPPGRCRARRPAARRDRAQGRRGVHREGSARRPWTPTTRWRPRNAARAAAEHRKVEVRLSLAGRHGALDILASTDTADAIDFDTALAHAAADLKSAGSTDSLDVRRSQAVGVIARHYLGHGLGPTTKPRQVAINVHLHDQDTGRCDTTRAPISVEQVKSWCTHPDTQVVIRPVRDLNAHLRVDGYEVPARLRDHVAERDGTCVHPHCTKPARACDNDHCVPYDAGGPTSSANISPLCRRHHRAKTHGRWRYWFIRPGTYLWRSPHGYWFHRDGLGTTDLGRLTPWFPRTCPLGSWSRCPRKSSSSPGLPGPGSRGSPSGSGCPCSGSTTSTVGGDRAPADHRRRQRGLVDWDDPASWLPDDAMAAVDELCRDRHRDGADLRHRPRRTHRVTRCWTSTGSDLFVAEGIFAQEIVPACQEAGLLAAAYCVRQHPVVTFWRRLTRDLREHRKPPLVLVRAGWRCSATSATWSRTRSTWAASRSPPTRRWPGSAA